MGDDGDGGDESYMGRCGIWYMVELIFLYLYLIFRGFLRVF